MKNKNIKKIILTGGGTGGPVTPLLAIADEMQNVVFLWIGTKDGVERKMVGEIGIDYKFISSGKLRRYFSIKNFFDIFRIIAGFFQSCAIILKERPNLVISAGGFVSVPVAWAAWLLGVKVLIHQQDIRPGLANKLMAPFADIITVTFEKSLRDYGSKAVWTGNPVRRSLTVNSPALENNNKEAGSRQGDDKQTTDDRFIFKNDLPVVLVVGGGTGATRINKIIFDNLETLTKICNIIHIVGRGKKELSPEVSELISFYKVFDFLEPKKMAEALKNADVVVTRAGLGFLTELSFLEKPSIIIPMPNTHQEDNARIFKEAKAAIVLDQKKLSGEELINNIKKILDDKVLRNMLRSNMGKIMKKGANEKIINIINKTI